MINTVMMSKDVPLCWLSISYAGYRDSSEPFRQKESRLDQEDLVLKGKEK
jgi:hypothetical protein